MVHTIRRWLTFSALVATLCTFGVAQAPRPAKRIPLNEIVESLERAQDGALPTSYQVIRQYRLSGANDSKADTEVVAEVNFRPSARGNYRIQSSSGSSRGQQVVRRVLEREVERASHNDKARTALSRDNYDFGYIGEAILGGQSCYLLELKPKRRETDLISGRVWVDQHSFLTRYIEGELAKSPSWWLKKVRVTLTFADLDGTWLQTGMEAVADVRMVGPHTLTSRILDYRTANEVASARSDTRKQH